MPYEPYEWDEAKSEANIARGRLGFGAILDFDWDNAVTDPSPRHGEARSAALGLIGNRLYHVVYTRRGDRRRIISLRPASRKEREEYVQKRTRNTHPHG